MKLKAFNGPRAVMYGHELTPIQRAILLRSTPWLHTEVQFSSGVSFSATMTDGDDGARFKDIEYSHPA